MLKKVLSLFWHPNEKLIKKKKNLLTLKQGQKCGAKKAEVLTVGTHVSQHLCARLFPRDPVGNAKISQRIYLPNMLIHTNPFCEQVIYTCSKKRSTLLRLK